MKKIKDYPKLTKRDIDILNILLNSSKSLTATEIVNLDESLTINTVQAVLRKLLKNELIKVSDIVYSGTVLCRSYIPIVSAQEITISQFRNICNKCTDDISLSPFVAAFLDTEKDDNKRMKEIEELEIMLQNYKKDLEL